MTDDTIHFEVTSPVLTAEEARLLLDHLDNVQAATLLGDKWTCWVAAKRKLVFLEVDGTSTEMERMNREMDYARENRAAQLKGRKP